MINNETMKSILARRSYKTFDGRPIDDEALETIVTAGLYAPTGMNRQPWHFTVIKGWKSSAQRDVRFRCLPAFLRRSPRSSAIRCATRR